MNKPVKVLIVEDSEDDALLTLRALRRGGLDVAHRRVETAAEFRSALAEEHWDAIISDFSLPVFSGMEALRVLQSTGQDTPFVLISGKIGEETAVEAMKAGASDYVMKSNLARLAPALERELNEARSRAAHRRAQHDLIESEARFRSLTKLSSDWYWEQDEQFRFVSFSGGDKDGAWGRDQIGLVGLRRWELPGVTPLSGSWDEHKAQVGAHKPFRDFEYQRTLPDGTQNYVAASGEPVFDDSGRFTGYRGVAVNITGRKRAELELQRFRAAMDISADAIVLVERASMRYIDVNQTLCEGAGLTREQLLCMTPMDLLGESRETLERDYDSLIAGNDSVAGRVEGQGRRKDGSIAFVETRRRALRTDAGWIIVGITRDVTERKEAEEKILRLNRVYAVLSGINSAIVRIRERSGLFSETCRIAVSEGGFIAARVVAVDPDGRARIAATSETDPTQFQQVLDEYNADPAHAPSAIGRVLRSGEAVISNDVAHDPRVSNREALTKAGNYALALLPIFVGERLCSVLTLRAHQAGAFDQYELLLLNELTGNLSFALDHMEKEEKLAVLAGEKRRDEDALRRFRTAMDVSGDALVLVDRATLRYIDVNQSLCALVGRTRDELIGMSALEVFCASRETLERDYDALIADNNSATLVEGQYRHKDGSMIPIETRRRALRTPEGWIIVGTSRDITARKAVEKRINYLNRVHAMLSGINSLIVRAHERDLLFGEACRIAVAEGGFRAAWIGIVDREAIKIVPTASAGASDELVAELKERFALPGSQPLGDSLTARAIREKRMFVSNDSQHDPRVALGGAHLSAGIRSMALLPLIVSGESIGVLGLYAGEVEFFHADELKLLADLAGDISYAIDHIEKQARLDYLAYYDVLTGLANRTLFVERVAQHMTGAAGEGRTLALFMLDLERFRNINDSLGRAAGDALLGQVAEWLKRNLGGASVLARVGADHFAVVLPAVSKASNVTRLVEKKIEAFRNHLFHLNDADFRVAIKVGVALFPDDAADADTLLRNAEAALKKAKSRGDRFAFYEPEMTAKVAGKLSLENKLRRALENEEYVLHYQPKVSLETEKITGAEALIRWNDPQSGLVPPGQFIPVLEETGLIHEVGRWALRKALADYLRWHGVGLAAKRIAVNVSPLQLRDPGFIGEVGQAVGIDPQAPGGLELEITESLIMEDVRHSIASLKAIREMEVCVAIDDFGTGFSSLSYLAKLPVDTLKIDRSFVIEMTAGPDGLALVSTIINLAHSLKLKVVAEGVETEEQARLLRLLHCDEMQGYLFSKPIPAAEFEAKFLAPRKAA